MVQQLIVLNESAYFKRCEIVEGFPVSGGFQVKEHFLADDDVVVLKEKLDKRDETKIKKIVRDILKKYFWRQYTRSAFLLR